MIQLMPDASDEVIDKLEKRLSEVAPVTTLFTEGHTPESILEYILQDFDIQFTQRIPAKFSCNCSKERVAKALAAIGSKELEEMIQDGKTIEMNCHFCNTDYFFEVEELVKIKNSL